MPDDAEDAGAGVRSGQGFERGCLFPGEALAVEQEGPKGDLREARLGEEPAMVLGQELAAVRTWQVLSSLPPECGQALAGRAEDHRRLGLTGTHLVRERDQRGARGRVAESNTLKRLPYLGDLFAVPGEALLRVVDGINGIVVREVVPFSRLSTRHSARLVDGDVRGKRLLIGRTLK